MRKHVWQLRSRRCFAIIERALWAAVENDPVTRIVEFSVQSNHIHLIVETKDRLALGRRMQAFAIRVAKNLNGLMNARGAVFATRYHSRVLRTPTQVRHALVYVLQNSRKHSGPTARFTPGWKDPYSSALWFTGFVDAPPTEIRPSPTCAAETWMLSIGWHARGGGKILLDELPRGD
jgi:REP element-mobilizing transposase RayT